MPERDGGIDIRKRIESPISQVLIDDLKRQIANGQAIAIVGAGVSMGATGNAPTASWVGLLKHGIARCEELRGRCRLGGDSGRARQWRSG